MLRIHEIKLRTDEPLDKLIIKAERKLKLPKGSLFAVNIAKESLDAREKPVIYRVFSLDLSSDLSDEQLLAAAKKAGVKAAIVSKAEKYRFPAMQRVPKKRPVIVGFGPCGMFAALVLAEYGLKPIVLERGARMDERIAAVEEFWRSGKLSRSANVQFGEGGAGTFSDGKLTTGTKDAAQRFVLESFVDAGASTDILYKQHPHIGTDVLRRVVVNIRKKIESLGGEVLFDTQLTEIDLQSRRVCGVRANDKYIETEDVILALGHSARDTMEYLYSQGLLMEQKPFSMGVRIEHLQKDVDYAQYAADSHELGLTPAEYKLFTKVNGRGVYTFCMCPGGYVVASASEDGLLVTNGMSNMDRGGKNANSALLCDVRPEDFGSDHPLAGMYFQENYERLAHELGGSNYKAPAQTVGSFLGKGNNVPGEIEPTYKPGVTFTDIKKCLPDFVSEALAGAIPELGRKMKGFDNPKAVLTAIESRSSSPVRIARNDRFLAECGGAEIKGLYPGGEGAGYAGGIMSAACDGIHLAEMVVRKQHE